MDSFIITELNSVHIRIHREKMSKLYVRRMQSMAAMRHARRYST